MHFEKAINSMLWQMALYKQEETDLKNSLWRCYCNWANVCSIRNTLEVTVSSKCGMNVCCSWCKLDFWCVLKMNYLIGVSLEGWVHSFKLILLARIPKLVGLFSLFFIFIYCVVRKNLTTSSCFSLVAVKK